MGERERSRDGLGSVSVNAFCNHKSRNCAYLLVAVELLGRLCAATEARPTMENPLIPVFGWPCLKALGPLGAPSTPRPLGALGGATAFTIGGVTRGKPL